MHSIGEWLTDGSGIWEIFDLNAGPGNLNYLKEVIIDEDIDSWRYGDERILTSYELGKMERF